MADTPKEFSDFWTKIDPYFQPEHAQSYYVDTILPTDTPIHHLSFKPILMPLLYFEEGPSDSRKLFIGSVKGLDASMEDGHAARGSVFLSTYLVTRNLNQLIREYGGNTLRASTNDMKGFPVFSQPHLYRNLTADHDKVDARLKELEVDYIDITDSPYAITKEMLVNVMRKYNQNIRARNRDIRLTDPFGLIYNCTEDELDGRIEKALAEHR